MAEFGHSYALTPAWGDVLLRVFSFWDVDRAGQACHSVNVVAVVSTEISRKHDVVAFGVVNFVGVGVQRNGIRQVIKSPPPPPDAMMTLA